MTTIDVRTPARGDDREGFVDPTPILDANYALARTCILLAAVKLGVFTHLSDGQQSAATVADRAGTIKHATARLLDALVAQGFLERDLERYWLAPVAERWLVEGRPSYIGGDTLTMLEYLPAWLAMDETIRTGRPYRDLGEPREASRFYVPRAGDIFPLAYPLARRAAAGLDLPASACVRVLDVGAGWAPWGVALAQQDERVMVTAVELPDVAAEARRNLVGTGVADRIEWLDGDVLDVELPADAFDIAVVGNLCRFLGEAAVRSLFVRVHGALRPGGQLVVADVIVADDRSGPPYALVLDLSMLVNTSQGATRSAEDYTNWLRRAGFASVEERDISGPSPILLATRGRSDQP